MYSLFHETITVLTEKNLILRVKLEIYFSAIFFTNIFVVPGAAGRGIRCRRCWGGSAISGRRPPLLRVHPPPSRVPPPPCPPPSGAPPRPSPLGANNLRNKNNYVEFICPLQIGKTHTQICFEGPTIEKKKKERKKFTNQESHWPLWAG